MRNRIPRLGSICIAGVRMVVFLLVLAGCSSNAGSEQQSRQQALEEEFERTMAGATLQGHFTVEGPEPDRLRPEKYTIEKVSKIAGDYWTIHTRIQYGEHDLTAPVPVKIVWAGDTPVVTLTDVTIPGLGTFTARVLFHRGQYAGTWSHGETRGNQFGRIIPATP